MKTGTHLFSLLLFGVATVTAGIKQPTANLIVIDSSKEWEEATGTSTAITLKNGFAEPTQKNGFFSSSTLKFDKKRQPLAITFKQSPVWDNWKKVDDITPPGLDNAYVFLPIAPGNYYVLAEKKKAAPHFPKGSTLEERLDIRKKWEQENPYSKADKGYHAWHSCDLKKWEYCGKVADSKWVTTAEYADGKFYIYYDEPNDQDPHLIIDDNLKDGVIGQSMGKVFDDPTHGSDSAVFRDEDGTFNLIFEDWRPINARENAWDSPLAGRVSSPDGIVGFEFGEHPPVIDHRTTPTGKTGTYAHGASAKVNNGSPDLSYEIHEPAQNAYGDYTMIKVGDYYHLFCDFDSADHDKSMRMGRFCSNDLNKEFTWSGEIGEGFHPDPSVGFAEGMFYIVMQKETDFMSPGPWVDGVEARAGVDVNGNGQIDQWTDWETVKETYSQKPGFARIVDVAPAQLDLSSLPAGAGVQLEFKTISLEENQIQPIMDRIEIQYK